MAKGNTIRKTNWVYIFFWHCIHRADTISLLRSIQVEQLCWLWVKVSGKSCKVREKGFKKSEYCYPLQVSRRFYTVKTYLKAFLWITFHVYFSWISFFFWRYSILLFWEKYWWIEEMNQIITGQSKIRACAVVEDHTSQSSTLDNSRDVFFYSESTVVV